MLYQLDVLQNLDEFKNKKSKEAKCINFAEVERGLREMHLKFESKLINQIMDEERGAALRLLFQIKLNREEYIAEKTMTGLNKEMIQTKLLKTSQQQKIAMK